MVKIRLFCAAGMSTSLLVTKMKESANKKGIEVDILAFPEGQLDSKLEGVDVALLGPQVRYRLAEDRKICEKYGVPIEVIPIVDYGMMNGEKVLDFAMKLAKK